MDLQASSVSKSFGGVAALSGADFVARSGEVHALLGENGAGKSTFIQILAGSVRPDSGRIVLDSKPFRADNPRQAHGAGISAVFQELSLVPDLTVAQNIWFRHEPLSFFKTIRKATLRERATELFERFGIPAPSPDIEVRRLTLAERQVVEIAKALARAPSVLILDEATSALPPRETEWLLNLSRTLSRSGMLVIFISHRLAEVRHVADSVTVFRNGKTVASHPIDEVSDDEIIAEMLGRRMERLYPERKPTATSNVALRTRGLAATRLAGIDLDLHDGEVLGVAGLQGHGQRELFQSLFGVIRPHGTIELRGKPVAIRSPRQALGPHLGLAMVPEDRRQQGLLLSKSIRENLTLSVIPRFSRLGVLDAKRERQLVGEMMQFLRIKATTPEQLAGTLSGGNQQKVIFGKMLLTEARVLLLYDPTRGVDVGTKGEIFQLMRNLAAKGYAILFYSSDLPELVHVADRVIVLRNGRVAAMLAGNEISERHILRAAMFQD
jgi:ribose transport system ATP-binding protein